jgi:uncharacterized protein
MKIVWDEPKRRSNLEKHKLDFEDVIDFEWETAHIQPAHSGRMKAVGHLRSGIAVVVYAELGTEAISIISFRPAKRKERILING